MVDDGAHGSTTSHGSTPSRGEESDLEPDMRPLGILALIFAVPAFVLSITYFLSGLALLFAAVALPLGLLARGHPQSRALGTAAMVAASVGVALAILTLIDVGS